MDTRVLLDYEFALSSQAYVVRALLKLEGHAVSRDNRIPLNLSLVLDRSGSMAGEKLAAARAAAALLVRRLHPEDVVSVVTYDDHVATLAPPATGAEQPDLPHRLASIQSGGSTNLSGGWLQGREHVAARLRGGGSNRVILLTDGLANVGITEPSQLVGLCRAARERGITTTTIGFGADYDEHLLRGMAEAGGGHTYYIEQPDQAAGIFGDEIEGLLTLSAQNVAVEVRPTDAARLVLVHHKVPRVEIDRGVRLELGDLYAREPKSLLIEFLVPEGVPEAEVAIADLVVTAHVLTSTGGVERQELRLPIRLPLDRAGRSEPEVRREMLLVQAARSREAALEDRQRGDFEAASVRLREVATRMRREGDADDEELREESDDLQQMAGQFEARRVDARDLKYMHQRAWNLDFKKPGSTRRISRTGGPRGQHVQYRQGDATQPQGPGRKLIVHLCDELGSWGGFARPLSRRWPTLEARFHAWERGELPDAPPFRLGSVDVVQVEAEIWVGNMLAKRGTRASYGTTVIDYNALDAALREVAEAALTLGLSVHLPRIGSSIAGGEWDVIEQMIEQHVGVQGIPVTVYDLGPRPAHR
jgi:Ca-activated chloride channel homolog